MIEAWGAIIIYYLSQFLWVRDSDKAQRGWVFSLNRIWGLSRKTWSWGAGIFWRIFYSHVTSPCGLGFLPTWWPRTSGRSRKQKQAEVVLLYMTHPQTSCITAFAVWMAGKLHVEKTGMPSLYASFREVSKTDLDSITFSSHMNLGKLCFRLYNWSLQIRKPSLKDILPPLTKHQTHILFDVYDHLWHVTAFFLEPKTEQRTQTREIGLVAWPRMASQTRVGTDYVLPPSSWVIYPYLTSNFPGPSHYEEQLFLPLTLYSVLWFTLTTGMSADVECRCLKYTCPLGIVLMNHCHH